MSLGMTRMNRRTLGIGAGASLAAGSLHYPAAAMQATPGSESGGLQQAELEDLLNAAAPSNALLVSELVDGGLSPIMSVNPDTELPIGSTFKIWILATLAEQVEQGVLSWDQVVMIEDQYRSVPGGDLRYALEGTVYTMRYLAERMMQKSDNTATDHLLFLAGRENVEAMMATTIGISDPSLNIPLLSTREFAMLKLASTPEDRAAYLAADVTERRRILAEEISAIPYSALADLDQTVPIDVDTLEWFATRKDIARTFAWLWEASQREGLLPVKEVIALETQLPFDGEIWPYVGFKGGSELGVLSGSWLMQRADARMFVFSIGFMNTEAEVDIDAALEAMTTVRDAMALIP